ncbi:microtubule-associated protein 9 [Diretmus argenteus]
MTDKQFRTLAYTKSPKTSRRTTFQDELEAAVAARASKTNPDQYFYSDAFNEDDDDFLNQLLASRKKKTGALKAGKSKAKINDFELSDDEGKSGRPKKVSFLKTQRLSSPSQDSMAPNLMHVSETDSVIEREPPIPKPRQRTFGLNFHTTEEPSENTGSQDLSRPPTSSVSIPLSKDTATTVSSPDRTTARSSSPHRTEGGLSKDSSLVRSEQSTLLTKSTVDSGSADRPNSDDSKEQEGKYSTSFEEFHEVSEDHSDHSIGQLKKSFATRASSSLTKSSQRSKSVCFSKVESKYMGTLKVLDRKVSLEDLQPQAADSLRAAIYQEWLKKKKERLSENMQLQKQEETLKDKTKKEKQAKIEDAVASYEAWKEKKAEFLKAKAKEKQDMLRKEQRAIEEREEKNESAKRVFEKWKQEHDEILKEKYRKQREAENKLKLKKQETEEERKINSKSAFSSWDEKKKNVINEKVMMERRKNKNTAEEERYQKEERDQMASETYEKWLTRKELQQRRDREERRIQAILQNSPPPPWSPPNKTVPGPFRK